MGKLYPTDTDCTLSLCKRSQRYKHTHTGVYVIEISMATPGYIVCWLNAAMHQVLDTVLGLTCFVH